MIDPIDTSSHTTPRQRSARTDPAMRDGDSAHGNPYETAGDEVALDSDSDVGDSSATEEAVEGVLSGRTGRQTVTVDPDRLDTLADGHTGPEDEAAEDEEEYAAEAAEAGLPIAGYEGMTVAEIVEQARRLSAADVNSVAAYERRHRNRRTLLAKLERFAKPAGGSGSEA